LSTARVRGRYDLVFFAGFTEISTVRFRYARTVKDHPSPMPSSTLKHPQAHTLPPLCDAPHPPNPLPFALTFFLSHPPPPPLSRCPWRCTMRSNASPTTAASHPSSAPSTTPASRCSRPRSSSCAACCSRWCSGAGGGRWRCFSPRTPPRRPSCTMASSQVGRERERARESCRAVLGRGDPLFVSGER